MLSSRTCLPSGSTPTFEPAAFDGLPGDEHGRVRRRRFDGQQRGHHLRQARDAQARVGVARPQHLAGVEVEQQRRRAAVRGRRRAPGAAGGSPIPVSASAGLPSGRPIWRARWAVAIVVAADAGSSRRRRGRGRVRGSRAPWRGPSRPARRRSPRRARRTAHRAPARAAPLPDGFAPAAALSGVMNGEVLIVAGGLQQRADDPDPEQHEDEDRDGAEQRKALFGTSR